MSTLHGDIATTVTHSFARNTSGGVDVNCAASHWKPTAKFAAFSFRTREATKNIATIVPPDTKENIQSNMAALIDCGARLTLNSIRNTLPTAVSTASNADLRRVTVMFKQPPLRIDCHYITADDYEQLADILSELFEDVTCLQDIILAQSPLSSRHYDIAWQWLDQFNVFVS